MSRVVNLKVSVQAVTTLCTQQSIGISTIEPLDSGGSRVVLRTADDAEMLRRKMKGKTIDGPVVRSGLYMARQPLPFS